MRLAAEEVFATVTFARLPTAGRQGEEFLLSSLQLGSFPRRVHHLQHLMLAGLARLAHSFAK